MLYNAYNIYQIFINTFIPTMFKTRSENEQVGTINRQFIEHSQASEPCRSCTDFQTFSRMRRQEFSQVHNFQLLYNSIVKFKKKILNLSIKHK